jgi:transcription termination factor NusB
MRILNDLEFDFILDDLEQLGVTREHIRLELADHIGCILEQLLTHESDFRMEYSKVLESIDSSRLPAVQRKILLSENLKFQAMKKTTYVLGAISAIMLVSGAILKTNHIAGASIILTIGTFIIVMGFLPTLFYTSYKEEPSKLSFAFAAIGFIVAASLLTGVLFKAMHWPGANVLLLFGQIILVTGFFPAYVVAIFRNVPSKQKIPMFIMLVLISASALFMISTISYGKEFKEQHIGRYEKANSATNYFSNEANALTDSFNSSIINEIKNRSNKLDSILENTKQELLKESEIDVISVNSKHLDSKSACYKVMIKKEKGALIANSTNAYSEFLLQSVKNAKTKHVVETYLGNIPWYDNTTLLITLVDIAEIQRNVRMAEYEAISELVTAKK